MESIIVLCGAIAIVAAIFLWKVFKGDKRMESKKTKIVIVGLERSAKFGKCPGSAHDVATMVGILSEYGSPVVLQDSAARKSSVVKALESSLDSDLMIFYYSGHGGSDTAKYGGEDDGMDEYLCLYDTALFDDEIWSIISKAKGRVFCIFDCCHSATMYQIAESDGEKEVKPEVESKPFTFQKSSEAVASSNVNLLVWSGCPDSSFSYGDKNGGILTNAIRDAFKKDKTYNDVWTKVKRLAETQNPIKTQIGIGFGGKVFL